MRFEIVSPTKALVKDATADELAQLREDLTYINSAAQHLLKRHYANKWYRSKSPEAWAARLEELKADVKKTLVFDDGTDIYVRPGSLVRMAVGYEIKNLINYPTPKKIPWAKPLPFTLHPYQEESVEKLIAERHGSISITTGGGKSAIILKLLRELGQDSVVVVPSASIFNEILEKARFHLGAGLVGGFGDGKKNIDKKFTIAISNSLANLESGTAEYDFFANKKVFIGDECFPYGTYIQTKNGPIPIGQIHKQVQAGTVVEVLSFNEKLAIFEFKKVTNSWKKNQKPILRHIVASNIKFKCTEDHKLLTQRGWIKAKALSENDYLIGHRGIGERSSCAHSDLFYKIPNQQSTYAWNSIFPDKKYVKVTKNIEFCVKNAPNYQRNGAIYDLYDLEIEDNHNFVVGKSSGIVAHNCHTLPAATLEKVCHGVLKDAPYRFLMSGTHTRGDGAQKLLESITGPIVHTLTTKDAIAGGYICTHDFSIVSLESSNPNFNSSDVLEMKRNHFLGNRNIAAFIAKLANSVALAYGQQTLVLVEELSQIAMLIKLLKVPYAYAHSDTNRIKLAEIGLEKADSADAVEKFNKNEVKVLIGTSCIATGTNIYPTHQTVNWVGGASEIKTKQGAVGRSVRKSDQNPYASSCIPKTISHIYDFDVKDVYCLDAWLQDRIGYYSESGTQIKKIKLK